MKTRSIIVCVFLFAFVNFIKAKECSCGSFEEGLVDYAVEDDGLGCCSGTPTGKAFFTTYIPGEGDTWEVVDIKDLKPAEAQLKCCPPV
jgi:hypothetical protein